MLIPIRISIAIIQKSVVVQLTVMQLIDDDDIVWIDISTSIILQFLPQHSVKYTYKQ